MNLTPMDIQRHPFRRKLRGFDPDEVRTYLGLVAEELATLLQQLANLKKENETQRELLEEHRQRETILKNTLLLAQRVSEEVKEAARKQSEATVREAELRADRLVELAQSRAHEVERGILDLRAQRKAVRDDLRALIGRVTQVLDLQEEAELEDNLRILKRREAEGA
ncbi:MAG: DivIVA domain-containing protein [Vicinamibacteria bacterium]|jgi:cell division initiation protein|nr:DivIVA domain-containing protein [Vicinamibacteria bacterium]